MKLIITHISNTHIPNEQQTIIKPLLSGFTFQHQYVINFNMAHQNIKLKNKRCTINQGKNIHAQLRSKQVMLNKNPTK